jgi:FKBP-type peptidyl-prolyl cis-trans isomerase SlyD
MAVMKTTLPKIEEALDGQDKGYQTTLVLSAADAFGERDEVCCKPCPRKISQPGVKVGGQLRGRTPDGREAIFNCAENQRRHRDVGWQPSLAGQVLQFQLNVLDVRAAIPEEIEHRHVHGAHGHHH